MKNKIIITIIFLTLLLSFSSWANAQQLSLSISPPLLKTAIKPGKSIMIAYNVGNYGDPVILSARMASFEPKDNIGNIRLKEQIEGPVRFSLDNSNIKLGEPFLMKTGDTQQLLLRIRIPDGAPEGDYYYTLLAESQPPPTFEGARVARAKATIGSNILITVTGSGKIDIKGKIAIFDALARYTINLLGRQFRIFDSNDKIPVVLIVDNRGKNLIIPEGEIMIRGNFGEKATYDIIPKNILAESQRLLNATNSAELDCPDNGTKPVYCKQPITLLISGFFLGLYKLSTTISLGENAPNLFASTSFIAIPFKLLIAAIVAIFIAIIIIRKISDRD